MRRLVFQGLIGAALVVVAGTVLYGRLFQPEAQVPEWTLASYTGEVSVMLDGGDWQPADVKMRVANRDRVRTGEDGEVTLTHGISHVTVRARTEVQVSDLRSDVAKFSIDAGSVFIEARGDRVLMRSQTGAAVDATDAGVGMTVKRDGYTLVQVKRGEADFSAMGQTERVREGQQADARAGRPPSRPVAIPDSILLNVDFPDAERFATRLLRLSGQADPGADVTIGGRTVATDDDGRFAAEVELQEGINQVEVSATDALGRTRTARSDPLVVDVTAPGLAGATLGSRVVATDAARRTP